MAVTLHSEKSLLSLLFYLFRLHCYPTLFYVYLNYEIFTMSGIFSCMCIPQTGVSGHLLQPEYCDQEITRETLMSTFLPSYRGRGMCAVALLDYLMTVHNDFMGAYSQVSRKR